MDEDENMKDFDLWENEDFLNEMNRRMDELETGKVRGVTLAELEAKF